MSSIKDKLLNMVEGVEEAKSNEQSLSGQLLQMYKQLKTNHKVKTLPEAKKLLKKKEDEKAALLLKLQKGIDALEEDYDWGAAI